MTRFICRHWYGWPCTQSKLAVTRARVRDAVALCVLVPLGMVAGAALAALITALLFAL